MRHYLGFDKAREKGIKLGRASLPDDIVREIVEAKRIGISDKAIMADYDVSRAVIYKYVRLAKARGTADADTRK